MIPDCMGKLFKGSVTKLISLSLIFSDRHDSMFLSGQLIDLLRANPKGPDDLRAHLPRINDIIHVLVCC